MSYSNHNIISADLATAATLPDECHQATTPDEDAALPEKHHQGLEQEDDGDAFSER